MTYHAKLFPDKFKEKLQSMMVFAFIYVKKSSERQGWHFVLPAPLLSSQAEQG